jgi:hypothetical protein
MELSPAEHLTNAETMRHILTVRALLMEAIRELVNRADAHDISKLGPPEVDIFTKFTPVLAGLTYGSEEYKAALKEMEVATKNHYAHNAHHPEHHREGVLDMDLFDLLEMLLDWKAATLRHKNGDIVKSLEINTKRFNIPEPLRKVLENTLLKLEIMTTRSRVAVSYPHIEQASSHSVTG